MNAVQLIEVIFLAGLAGLLLGVIGGGGGYFDFVARFEDAGQRRVGPAHTSRHELDFSVLVAERAHDPGGLAQLESPKDDCFVPACCATHELIPQARGLYSPRNL